MKNIILTHFTSKPFVLNKSKEYHNNNYDLKPNGLWLSDESSDGWSKWCKSEQFGLSRLKNKTLFSCDTSSWLVLDTMEKVHEFVKTYEEKYIPDLPLKNINWTKLSSQYGGILITPYYREIRHNYLFYSSWDVASACVWDLKTITRIK